MAGLATKINVLGSDIVQLIVIIRDLKVIGKSFRQLIEIHSIWSHQLDDLQVVLVEFYNLVIQSIPQID